jgi:hypothetical protein
VNTLQSQPKKEFMPTQAIQSEDEYRARIYQLMLLLHLMQCSATEPGNYIPVPPYNPVVTSVELLKSFEPKLIQLIKEGLLFPGISESIRLIVINNPAYDELLVQQSLSKPI